MVTVYRYRIRLLDPLFYAREGLGAAYTPPYLHATALNMAVKSALNLDPAGQPYIVSDENGGRNIPRYDCSLVSRDFYFTPGRLASALHYRPEVTKGETDGYVVSTETKDVAGKVFRAATLNYLAPETVFQGFLLELKPRAWPDLLRLGTFRGKARLYLEEADSVRPVAGEHTASHPVDPLVTAVERGVMVGMFPYPVVDNALCRHAVSARVPGERFPAIVAYPDTWQLPDVATAAGKGPLVI